MVYDENQHVEKTSEAGATLPRFLHRGATGDMRPLTGDDVGVIHGAD